MRLAHERILPRSFSTQRTRQALFLAALVWSASSMAQSSPVFQRPAPLIMGKPQTSVISSTQGASLPQSNQPAPAQPLNQTAPAVVAIPAGDNSPDAPPPMAPAAAPASTQPGDSQVTLNFPPNTPLVVLISYVSERLGINFVYEDQVAAAPITLRTPTPVRQSELLDILANVLQAKNLALEDTSVPQLKRIVPIQATMMAPEVARAERTLEGSQMYTRFYGLKRVRAEQLLPLVIPMLSRPTGRAAVLPEKQAMVVTDYAGNVNRIVDFLDAADSLPEQSTIRPVQIRNGDCKQLTQTIQALMQNNAPGLGGVQQVNIVPDETSNQIIIGGPTETVERLAALIKQLDAPREVQQTTVFYKLTNTVAADVLNTLRSLEGQEGTLATGEMAARLGARQVPMFGGPLPDAGKAPALNPAPLPRPTVQDTGATSSGGVNGAAKATIAADENTNSIIIIASPPQQQMYESIIKQLDQRRPQVMVETTVVTLDTSDNFSLGVDIAAHHNNGETIAFSSFGVSKVNPISGTLTPINAPGGTLALLNPDIADVVIRALSTSSRSRLVSMPRVLVNDNSTGKLKSVEREPFQRTVVTDGGNQIIGEGSNAEAGTSIEVTPHISNGDYLQLEYSVELSAFTGRAQGNLPPPSATNNVNSQVTIPDGHTIVVGGLNRTNAVESVNAIPILGQIPVLEYLFSSRSKGNSNTTLFVFIRPTILRDDTFRDLKYRSAIDLQAAKLPGDWPDSEPLTINPKQ